VIADASPSTRCGVNGRSDRGRGRSSDRPVGMSAVFFQDLFGMLTFQSDLQHLSAIRPRIGKNQVIHCLDAYDRQRNLQEVRFASSLSMTIASFMRKRRSSPSSPTSCSTIRPPSLKELCAAHDRRTMCSSSADRRRVCLRAAAHVRGWIDAFDVETGRSRMMSRATSRRHGPRASATGRMKWSRRQKPSISTSSIGLDPAASDIALAEFIVERRLRKVS